MKCYEAPTMDQIELQTENILDASSPLINFDEKEDNAKVEIGTLPLDIF